MAFRMTKKRKTSIVTWNHIIQVFILKVKVFPRAGPWGSGRSRLQIVMTFSTMKMAGSLPPGVSWYSFLEAESTPGHMVPLVAMEKIPSDTTGDQSRDPPTSSASP